MTSGASTTHRPSLGFANIQILRAVAAFSVYMFHHFDALQNDFDLFEKNVFEVGAYGVDIFFVISGFIICYASQSETSPISFAIKRLCRILPLYYLLTIALFGIALAAPSLLNSTRADPNDLLKSLLFIPYEKANGLVQPVLFLGWTLNYEMFFYSVFALSLMFSPRRAPWLASAAIVSLIAAGAIMNPQGVIGQFYTNGIMLSFVWGCVVFKVWQQRSAWLRRIQPFWPVFALLLIAQNFVPLGLPREISFGIPSAFLVAALLNVQPGDGPISRFFQTMGDASYSIYLVHPYFIQAVIKVVLPTLGIGLLSISVMTILALVGTIIGSWLLFQLVERPSNILLRRLLLRAKPAA